MKKTIIVTTDFSDSARNALNYACKFARDYNLNILLLCVYTVPNSYAAEGLSITTINDELEDNRDRLEEELKHAQKNYVNIHFEARMATGGFLESLQELRQETNAALIIMGADSQHSELWEAGDHWLNALVKISCPALVIPQHIAYSPIMRIAFATDNKSVSRPEYTEEIKKLVNLSNATLFVVHVAKNLNPEDEAANTDAYNKIFDGTDVQYHTVENSSIIRGLAEFMEQYFIDLLIVAPHRHGLWHNLLNKSYTKQLVLLNHIPVMAIHENEPA